MQQFISSWPTVCDHITLNIVILIQLIGTGHSPTNNAPPQMISDFVMLELTSFGPETETTQEVKNHFFPILFIQKMQMFTTAAGSTSIIVVIVTDSGEKEKHALK